jgi:hypothetical protein
VSIVQEAGSFHCTGGWVCPLYRRLGVSIVQEAGCVHFTGGWVCPLYRRLGVSIVQEAGCVSGPCCTDTEYLAHIGVRTP